VQDRHPGVVLRCDVYDSTQLQIHSAQSSTITRNGGGTSVKFRTVTCSEAQRAFD
jgi:hypothetical protein